MNEPLKFLFKMLWFNILSFFMLVLCIFFNNVILKNTGEGMDFFTPILYISFYYYLFTYLLIYLIIKDDIYEKINIKISYYFCALLFVTFISIAVLELTLRFLFFYISYILIIIVYNYFKQKNKK